MRFSKKHPQQPPIGDTYKLVTSLLRERSEANAEAEPVLPRRLRIMDFIRDTRPVDMGWDPKPISRVRHGGNWSGRNRNQTHDEGRKGNRGNKVHAQHTGQPGTRM